MATPTYRRSSGIAGVREEVVLTEYSIRAGVRGEIR